jgi:hypothetical protein
MGFRQWALRRMIVAAFGKETLVRILGRNWKTSLGGIVTALAALFGAVKALTDGDPATVPDWNVVITALAAACGLFFAKDYDVSGTPTNPRP